jgi:hypothetical protein
MKFKEMHSAGRNLRFATIYMLPAKSSEIQHSAWQWNSHFIVFCTQFAAWQNIENSTSCQDE